MSEQLEGDAETIADRVAALEAAVEELREEVHTVQHRDLPLLTGSVRAIVDTEIETIDDLPAAGRAFHREMAAQAAVVDELEQRLDSLRALDAEQTSKEQKIANVLLYAENKASSGQSKVAVSAQEIKGCVGCSRRYAYDLIEEIADVVVGVHLRDAQCVETGSGVKRKKKALLVDCEAVHNSSGDMNDFTTGRGDTGGDG